MKVVIGDSEPPPQKEKADGLGRQPAVKAVIGDSGVRSTYVNNGVHSAVVKDISWGAPIIAADDPELGRGSFGIVFRGKWKQPNSPALPIAVKVLSRSIANAKSLDYNVQLGKAMEEAQMVVSLRAKGAGVSDSIIDVYGFTQGPLPADLTEKFLARPGEEAFGIVMRLEEGGSLDHQLYKAGTQYDITEKLRILAGISKGLANLHGANVVHGDLKPANVLFNGPPSESNPPKVRLSDFGLSTLREAVASYDSTLDGTMNKRGTSRYCAPEMFGLEDEPEKVARASRRTDVYAFAITAWEVLAGQRPFEQQFRGNEARMVNEVVAKDTRPSMDSLPIGVPPNIRQMMEDCWSKDRQQRWTAQECFAALDMAYNRMAGKEFDIFLSHKWTSKKFLSHVHLLLCEHGYKVWYDMDHMGHDLNKSMEEGVEKSTVVLACVDTDYQKRPNCMLELLHAHKVVKEGKHRTKTIIGVLMENDIGWGANWGAQKLKDIIELKDLLASRQDISPNSKILDVLPANKMYVSYHQLLCPRALHKDNTCKTECKDGCLSEKWGFEHLLAADLRDGLPTPVTLQALRNHGETALLFKLLRIELGK